jgi:putative lipoic acid-binding regulatory protein
VADKQQSSLDLLREHHTFPGPYTIKVVGENTPALLGRIQSVVGRITGDKNPKVKVRLSANGKHQAVSVTAQVPAAEDVMALYEALRRVAGVSLLL